MTSGSSSSCSRVGVVCSSAIIKASGVFLPGGGGDDTIVEVENMLPDTRLGDVSVALLNVPKIPPPGLRLAASSGTDDLTNDINPRIPVGLIGSASDSLPGLSCKATGVSNRRFSFSALASLVSFEKMVSWCVRRSLIRYAACRSLVVVYVTYRGHNKSDPNDCPILDINSFASFSMPSSVSALSTVFSFLNRQTKDKNERV